MAAGNALVVSDLVVRNSDLAAVRGVSFTIPAGGRMGLVGESGSGKTLTALAVMGLLPMGWHAEGQVLHDGADLVTESDRALSQRRGRTLSMVFQDPLSALDPVRRVGVQISSVIRRHTKANRAEAARQTLELVRQMNLPRPEQIVRAYPHELSGGQRQRIMIAMSLACYPQLIIADEPTTALDVTVQKQVLRLLNGAVRDRGCALLMITHDLPIIAAMCDTVAVMYAGRIIEMGPVGEVFRYPRHHYTRGLLDSQPTMDNIALDGSSRLVSIPGMVPPLTSLPTGCAFHPRCPAATEKCRATLPELDGETRKAACWHPLAVAQKSGRVAMNAAMAISGVETAPILEVRSVSQVYRLRRQRLFASPGSLKVLCDINFDVGGGEAVGIVGESGAGKTTLTRMLTGVEKPLQGEVLFEGQNVWSAGPQLRRFFRRSVQVVLQNPRSSLDPRMRVGTSLLEPLRSLRIEGDHAKRVFEVLDQVGLAKSAVDRFPHEFSGGQLQRIAIARALMPAPKVLIADEPVSALDVSIQAQVLNLIRDLVRDLGLSLVLIAHDLSVVAYTTSRVSVMSAGRIVEIGRPLDLFVNPQADATRNLVGAILSVEAGLAGTALE